MSIKMMTAIWDHSRAKGSALLLLLSIADNASDNGLAWPGIETLAQRTRLGKRAVIKLLDKVEKDGELKIHRRAGKHNHYILNVNLTDEQRDAALIALAKRVGESVEQLRGELYSLVNHSSLGGEPQFTSTGEPQNTRSIKGTTKETKGITDLEKQVSDERADQTKISPKRQSVQPHVAIIDAWYDGMPAPPITRKYPRNVATAKRIVDGGYTPEQVKACTEDKCQDEFWQNKLIPLERIEDDLPLWVKQHTPPAPIVMDAGTLEDQRARQFAHSQRMRARVESGEFTFLEEKTA